MNARRFRLSVTNDSSTITLTKQEDGRTWKNNGSTYLLPPCSQPASVSVNITMGGTTKTYTYNTSGEMEAGYKINIDGTFRLTADPDWDSVNGYTF